MIGYPKSFSFGCSGKTGAGCAHYYEIVMLQISTHVELTLKKLKENKLLLKMLREEVLFILKCLS